MAASPGDVQPSESPANETVPRGKKARTRRTILAAAGELFAAQGVDRTTVEEIASEAGVSVGTIYAHFGSKAALALAFYDGALDVLESYLQEVREQDGLSARERMLSIGDAYFRFAMDQPVAFRFSAIRALQPDVGPEFEEMNQAIASRVQRIVLGIAAEVKAAMVEGEILTDPIDETMIFLWGLWNGVVTLVLRQDGASIPPELGLRAIEFGRRILNERLRPPQS